jgi:hypothetical protein
VKDQLNRLPEQIIGAAIRVHREIHTAPVSSYLRLSGCKVGLLINFNVKWLLDHGIKRIVNDFPD